MSEDILLTKEKDKTDDTQTLLIRVWAGLTFIGGVLGSDDDGLYVSNPLQLSFQKDGIHMAPIVTPGAKAPNLVTDEFRFPHKEIMWVLEAEEGMTESYHKVLGQQQSNIIITNQMPRGFVQ